MQLNFVKFANAICFLKTLKSSVGEPENGVRFTVGAPVDGVILAVIAVAIAVAVAATSVIFDYTVTFFYGEHGVKM